MYKFKQTFSLSSAIQPTRQDILSCFSHLRVAQILAPFWPSRLYLKHGSIANPESLSKTFKYM